MLVVKLGCLGGTSRAAPIGVFPLWKPERLSEAVRGFGTKGLLGLGGVLVGLQTWDESCPRMAGDRWWGSKVKRLLLWEDGCLLVEAPSPDPAHAGQEGERARRVSSLVLKMLTSPLCPRTTQAG